MSDRRRVRLQALHYIASLGVSPVELLLSLLLDNNADSISNLARNELVLHTQQVLSALAENAQTANTTSRWLHQQAQASYSGVVRKLSSKEFGWHFNAANARAEQIENFRIEDMMESMQTNAPELWSLVFSMLSGGDAFDESVGMDPEAGQEEHTAEEFAKWEAIESENVTPAARIESLRDKQRALTVIKTVTVISILMQGRNTKCNALQSTMGIFLHSCNAPEKIMSVLCHMGLSIGISSIHRAIHSLSAHSHSTMEALAQTRLASYAFDNFDIKFHTLLPTVDSPGDGMVHLTSATMIQLEHDVTVDDLRCSNLIWNRQDLRLNPKATDPRVFNPLRTLELLYSLHPQASHESGLSRRGRFNSWFFRRVLFQHGPQWFRQYYTLLCDPEVVEAIPIKKMQQVPFRAMDINPSTVAGNIQAIEELLMQAGLEDIVDNAADLDDLITPTHGDLGSFDHILSALKVRSIEMTPVQRLQFIIFIIGLFHLKMAAADAVWRILVAPAKGENADTTSFMKYVAILRPNETSKLSSKPEFRQQHELIEQVLNVLILDAWRTQVEERHKGKYRTLEEYAASHPSLAELEDLAHTLARDYVAGETDDRDLYSMRMNPVSDRDQQNENTLLMLQILLLYQELSYAMNAGDIGRVETLFAPWIQVFRATGKHKYGNRLLLFNHNLHFVYPDRLRRAIRLNMLVNPTGKAHEFRAVDWIVELLNLYIKHIYGGEGSNYTKNRILAESPLVLLFRSSHANFERNFGLTGLTTRHAKKNMSEMYRILLTYMAEHRPNAVRAGRKSTSPLTDSVSLGASVLLSESIKYANDGLVMLSAEGEEDLDMGITAEDLSTEGFM